MHNKASNTKADNPEDEKYAEMIQYWNFYHTDELITINWQFYTAVDNLSFLGGLLDIGFLIPWIIMVGYTFRLNELNVFFFQQVMKKWKDTSSLDQKEVLGQEVHTKYSRYIMENYFWISFKIAFALAVKGTRLKDFYEYLKGKLGHNSKKVSNKRK